MENNNMWNGSSRRRVSIQSTERSAREGGARPRFSVYQQDRHRGGEQYGGGQHSRQRVYGTKSGDEYRAPRQHDTERGSRSYERSAEGSSSWKQERPIKQRFNSNNYSQKKRQQYQKRFEDPTKPIRLNKYLANAGVCSRREADDFIQAGVITVNGEVVTTLGAKINPTDKVMFHDQLIRRERKVYILLNKPKNTVTTTDDPQERQTVLDIVRNACTERIYPVGRLDRNTTGVLLLTNDGDLAARLTHPKFGKKKVYAATIDKDLTEEDYNLIMHGVELDGDIVVPDALEFTKDDRRHIGLEIHSGQNRVVRRMFEKVGYKVMQLDRVSFAGLTKKNVQRGKYRFLTPKEVAMLQMGAFE